MLIAKPKIVKPSNLINVHGVVKFFNFKKNFGFVHSPELKRDIYFLKNEIVEPFGLVFKNEQIKFLYNKSSNKATKIELSSDVKINYEFQNTTEEEENKAFQIKSLTKIGKLLNLDSSAYVNQNNDTFYLNLSKEHDCRINIDMQTSELYINFLMSHLNLMCFHSEPLGDNIFNPEYIINTIICMMNNSISAKFKECNFSIGDNNISISKPIATGHKCLQKKLPSKD